MGAAGIAKKRVTKLVIQPLEEARAGSSYHHGQALPLWVGDVLWAVLTGQHRNGRDQPPSLPLLLPFAGAKEGSFSKAERRGLQSCGFGITGQSGEVTLEARWQDGGAGHCT